MQSLQKQHLAMYVRTMCMYTWIHKFTMLFIEVSLAPGCFDTEDTQVDPITAVVVLVVVIVAVAVVVVTLMAGVSFDPFSIMICKQSVMQIYPAS